MGKNSVISIQLVSRFPYNKNSNKKEKQFEFISQPKAILEGHKSAVLIDNAQTIKYPYQITSILLPTPGLRRTTTAAPLPQFQNSAPLNIIFF